jgi:cysteine-rich repeat protein
LIVVLASTVVLGGARAYAYTVGGPGAVFQTLNASYRWDGGSFVVPLRVALEDPANFGPAGVVDGSISTVDLTEITPASLTTLDGFISPWWSVSESGPFEQLIVDFFLGGGDLWLLQDSSGRDGVGALLGVPTVGQTAGTPVNGGAPLFDGPFGMAANITQGGGEEGFLSDAHVLAAGGTIVATNTEDQVIAAVWNPGEFAAGSGTLIVVADIDMFTTQANFSPLDDNGVFTLNAFAFLSEPTCGDGTLERGEECDDGNELSCDGCSEICEIERGGRLDTDLVFAEPLTTIDLLVESMASVDVSFENTGLLPVRVTSVDFLPDWIAPAVDVFPIAEPFSVCPGATERVTFEVDSAETPEGLYGGFLRLSGDPGFSEASHRVDVRVLAPGLPDLTPLSVAGVIIDPSPAGASEDFDIHAGVDNIGLADAEPFTVHFFAGDDLLGTSDVPGGLAALASTAVSLRVAGGTLVDGFHVIRVEVAPPAGGESDETNNSATTVHEVGTPGPSSDAIIIVSPGSSATVRWGEASIQGSGRADYLLTSGSSLHSFPVKGGLTTISLLDSTATNVIATFPPTHTLTNGTFSQSIESPPPGDYVVRIEVTDFTLAAVEDIPLHVGEPPVCEGDRPGGGPLPPQFTGGGVALGWDFSVCAGDLTLLDETCTTPIFGDLAAGSGVCVEGTVHYSGAFTVLNQPTSFVAHIQQGGGFREELIDTQLVNFAGSANGGSGSVQVQTLWFPPGDGEHVIEFRIDPTVSCWFTPRRRRVCERLDNNTATTGLRVGAGEPRTGVVVSASVGGCWKGHWGVSGSAHYADSSLPVGCGFVGAELFDAADTSVPISTSPGTRTTSFGDYGTGATGTSTPGEFVIRATVSDGTLTGTTERDLSCEEPPPPPPPPSLCGDDMVNDSGEECDGSDDLACPGECRTNCTCLPPLCGDDILDPGEACDGSDDLACPGECLAECTCPPPPEPPEPLGFGDLYLFAEHVAFVGSCEPPTGLLGIPEAGDTLGVFATINYVGPAPLVSQDVRVTEIFPVGDILEELSIGSTTVDFPDGNGQDTLCLPWTPLTNGTRIVQVEVDPDVEQFELNDAATRAFRVGSDVCRLELSATTIQPATGFPVSLDVTGTDTSDLTNVLDLTVLPLPDQTIPPGMTTSFDPSPPLATPFTTSLTVGVDNTTPPGSYSLVVVGSSDACTALDVFTVSVSASDACAGVVCPEGPCGTSTCDPGTGACVLDALPATTVCRESAGPCDVAESCTGSSVVCPDDGFEAATTECRASAGLCDVAESCSGNGPLCPDDGFKAAATECRTSAGICDLAESCSGNGPLCPDDGFKAATTECRASVGICDVAESCSGSGPLCPDDGFKAATTECRASAGICDVVESCSGKGALCPDDGFEPATTECRAATDACDPAESCPGDGADCPADSSEPLPTLTVTKLLVHDDGGNVPLEDFHIDVSATQDGAPFTDRVAGDQAPSEFTLDPEPYAVSEDLAALGLGDFYAASFAGDCAADGTGTLTCGDAAVCEVTNDDIRAQGPSVNVTAGPFVLDGTDLSGSFRVEKDGDVDDPSILIASTRVVVEYKVPGRNGGWLSTGTCTTDPDAPVAFEEDIAIDYSCTDVIPNGATSVRVTTEVGIFGRTKTFSDKVSDEL